ncbi:ABC transporter ATP-binding protein [Thermaerobacter sp. PB12/4term]|uniref:ABC transporter ATP-binding protein n=1 Tax=Thermaerobacter sp. PB12/4term TaxID=2293838 RepID=UPI000E32675A|nr:ABC transporter ATP-binding protein [Thermaerobacter sp. PB12/4term]QIA27776.1 ABC transporter ATP-binding protein [Thermaerobacter sp. PB12/4term]
MALIELQGVEKVYRMGQGRVTALGGVDLTVDEGEFTAVMGPSGSGKSTLLHIIGCLDRPTAGSYRFMGREVGGLSETELARLRNRQFGFVFQRFFLLPRYRVWENVALPLAYAGVDRRRRRERAWELLHRVGLEGREEHFPNQLSGGQQQRVAIARALANGPAVLLADEPTGNLDSVTSAEILALFATLHRQGHTILLVTHDPAVAQQAQRVVHIRDGRIRQDERREAR